MYTQMVNSVKAKKIDEFICAGGTLTHYVGDACQPLHVSYLHAGIPGHETNVHGDYEDKLIDANIQKIRFDKGQNSVTIDNQLYAAQMHITRGSFAMLADSKFFIYNFPPLGNFILELFDKSFYV